jgi:hypothetical protein
VAGRPEGGIGAVLAYHESTKHSPVSIRSRAHVLDWGNKPHPLKVYTGLERVPLPDDVPSLAVPVLEAIGVTSVDASAPGPDLALSIGRFRSTTRRGPSTQLWVEGSEVSWRSRRWCRRTSLPAGSASQVLHVLGRRLKTKALVTGLKAAQSRICLQNGCGGESFQAGSIPVRLRYAVTSGNARAKGTL